MLVDDDSRLRHLVAGLLEENGYEVVAEASSGEEALERVDDTNPDAVVIDLVMEGMDGLDAVEEMRANHPDQAVVLFSSLFAPEARTRAHRLGAEYVEKADGLEALQEAIDVALVRAGRSA
jgi:CheY-like chemotaxis protein